MPCDLRLQAVPAVPAVPHEAPPGCPAGSCACYAVGLCLFGFLGAYLGGANVARGGMRVVVGGWLALAVVYGIGRALNVDAAA